jgi:hypothetical protein
MYKTSLVYAVLNFIPVMILEFVWLASDGFAKDVIKASDKTRKLAILKSKALRSK